MNHISTRNFFGGELIIKILVKVGRLKINDNLNLIDRIYHFYRDRCSFLLLGCNSDYLGLLHFQTNEDE